MHLQLVGRLDPNETYAVFDIENVTNLMSGNWINLELLNIIICQNQDHSHFELAERAEYPSDPERYQEKILITVPNPRQVTFRRRTLQWTEHVPHLTNEPAAKRRRRHRRDVEMLEPLQMEYSATFRSNIHRFEVPDFPNKSVARMIEKMQQEQRLRVVNHFQKLLKGVPNFELIEEPGRRGTRRVKITLPPLTRLMCTSMEVFNIMALGNKVTTLTTQDTLFHALVNTSRHREKVFVGDQSIEASMKFSVLFETEQCPPLLRWHFMRFPDTFPATRITFEERALCRQDPQATEIFLRHTLKCIEEYLYLPPNCLTTNLSNDYLEILKSEDLYNPGDNLNNFSILIRLGAGLKNLLGFEDSTITWIMGRKDQKFKLNVAAAARPKTVEERQHCVNVVNTIMPEYFNNQQGSNNILKARQDKWQLYVQKRRQEEEDERQQRRQEETAILVRQELPTIAEEEPVEERENAEQQQPGAGENVEQQPGEERENAEQQRPGEGENVERQPGEGENVEQQPGGEPAAEEEERKNEQPGGELAAAAEEEERENEQPGGEPAAAAEEEERENEQPGGEPAAAAEEEERENVEQPGGEPAAKEEEDAEEQQEEENADELPPLVRQILNKKRDLQNIIAREETAQELLVLFEARATERAEEVRIEENKLLEEENEEIDNLEKQAILAAKNGNEAESQDLVQKWKDLKNVIAERRQVRQQERAENIQASQNRIDEVQAALNTATIERRAAEQELQALKVLLQNAENEEGDRGRQQLLEDLEEEENRILAAQQEAEMLEEDFEPFIQVEVGNPLPRPPTTFVVANIDKKHICTEPEKFPDYCTILVKEGEPDDYVSTRGLCCVLGLIRKTAPNIVPNKCIIKRFQTLKYISLEFVDESLNTFKIAADANPMWIKLDVSCNKYF